MTLVEIIKRQLPAIETGQILALIEYVEANEAYHEADFGGLVSELRIEDMTKRYQEYQAARRKLGLNADLTRENNNMPKQGMRGTGDYPADQRSGGFKTQKTRVDRADVEAAMREVHRKTPKTVKKTGKKGKAKEKMLRAIAMSKAERRA